MNGRLVENYMRNLVNLFYKILPMWEEGVPTILTYISELRDELLACNEVMEVYGYDGKFLKLASTLQSFLDEPDMEISFVRRRVFSSIRTIEALLEQYGKEELL